MSNHILRDLPTKHAQPTLRPYVGYPKNGAKGGKFRFLPMTEISYIGANGTNGNHDGRKENGKFRAVHGESLVWGMFRRQVYCTVHPLMDGTDVLLKKGQKFIVAWPGNILDGNFRPISLWKGVMKNSNYTHYQLLAEVVSFYSMPSAEDVRNHVPNPVTEKSIRISYGCLFVRRELIDRQLPVPKELVSLENRA